MSDHPNIFLDNPDALSTVLSKLDLSAEVYVNGNFCGAWAVDTSGSRRIPFHLIGNGEAWLHMEGRPVRRLSAGDLVVFPHDAQHAVAYSDEVPQKELINKELTESEGPVTHMICGFFEFQNKAVWPLLDSLSQVVLIGTADAGVNSATRILINLMIEELEGQTPGFYSVINSLAHLLFIHIIRQQIKAGEINSGLLIGIFDDKISKALSAIHNQPDNQWTLQSLAKKAAMGRSSFARRFNELTGIPPIQYLTQWRMQEARMLLQTTNTSMAIIAEKCGYESEAAFRKAFRKTTGEAPGVVRRKAGREAFFLPI